MPCETAAILSLDVINEPALIAIILRYVYEYRSVRLLLDDEIGDFPVRCTQSYACTLWDPHTRQFIDRGTAEFSDDARGCSRIRFGPHVVSLGVGKWTQTQVTEKGKFTIDGVAYALDDDLLKQF